MSKGVKNQYLYYIYLKRCKWFGITRTLVYQLAAMEEVLVQIGVLLVGGYNWSVLFVI